MAAIQSAVPSALEPSAVGEWQDEQIGTLSGTDLSYGFAETTGSPANIPGGQHTPTLPGNPFSEGLDFIGEAVSPRYSPPMQTGIGPTIPYEASVQQAQVAHSEDTGTVKHNTGYMRPSPGNQYWMTQVKTPVQTTLKQYNPDGTQVMQPMGNSQVAQNLNWGDHENLNEGIGYYIQESDRPFYNTLAATAAVQQVGNTGYQMPYGGVETQGYNDGGSPTAYTAAPDPYVAPSATGAEAPPMGMGF
jgi:hypothetical protein